MKDSKNNESSDNIKELEKIIGEATAEELSSIMKDVSSLNPKTIAVDIAINNLAENPRISKNKLWLKVMFYYGKKTGEVLKRDIYNQIMSELSKDEYKV